MSILTLMKRRWAAAEKVERLTTCLVAAQRVARDAADALSDALSAESGARLVEILALAHPPKPRAKKGANGH
jgi:hypothetical protein